MEVLNLIRLFWGWVFPYISLTFKVPEMFGGFWTFDFLKWLPYGVHTCCSSLSHFLQYPRCPLNYFQHPTFIQQLDVLGHLQKQGLFGFLSEAWMQSHSKDYKNHQQIPNIPLLRLPKSENSHIHFTTLRKSIISDVAMIWPKMMGFFIHQPGQFKLEPSPFEATQLQESPIS